ncbi:MAG: SM-20-related protein, partial [Gammaproteobacteria bacterium]
MKALKHFPKTSSGNTIDETLFGLIADDIEKQGYSIQHSALPDEISSALYSNLQDLSTNKYSDAGIGRGKNYVKTDFVRT